MKNLKTEEGIEAYIKGKLSDADKKAFEALMAQDNAFAEEVAFNQDIIEGIKAYRKSVLKSKLKEIDLQMPRTEAGSGTSTIFAGYKAASVIFATISISAALYFGASYFSSEQEATQIAEVSANESVQSSESVPMAGHIPASSSTIISEVENASKPIENVKKNETFEKRPNTKVKSATQKVISIEKVSIAKPSDIDRHLAETTDNLSLDADVETPTELKSEIKVKKSSDIDVQSVDDGTHTFHYKLQNNTLHLFGKFDASPYEILEFKDKESVRIYLYYDSNYYIIENTFGKIQRLKTVTDAATLNVLRQSRVSK